MSPRWIAAHQAVRWHARLVERFGGAPGVRDLALLEGALARPPNRLAYEVDVSIPRLAALYGVGVTKARAFVDGNKRIGFAVMVAFLGAHGFWLDAREDKATRIMLAVAAGEMGEDQLEAWIRRHCRSEGQG